MEWVRFDRRRERFDAMLEATMREYGLFIQAGDLSFRLGRLCPAYPERHAGNLDAQRAFQESVSRRRRRREAAYDQAKRDFFFPKCEGVGDAG